MIIQKDAKEQDEAQIMQKCWITLYLEYLLIREVMDIIYERYDMNHNRW